MPEHDPSATTARRRGGVANYVLIGAGLLASLLCLVWLWIGFQLRMNPFDARSPSSPSNPSRGCLAPIWSRQEAIDMVLASFNFDGSIDGQPVVAAAEHVTGGTAALILGGDPALAQPGCAWIIELHARFLPSMPSVSPEITHATPAPPVWMRFVAAVDENGRIKSLSSRGLCSGIGTPCPTRTPPAGGWPPAPPGAFPTKDWMTDLRDLFLPGQPLPAPFATAYP